jgi:hypothetical protein
VTIGGFSGMQLKIHARSDSLGSPQAKPGENAGNPKACLNKFF